MSAARRKSTSDVAAIPNSLFSHQQFEPPERRRSASATHPSSARHPARRPVDARTQPSITSTRSTRGVNKLRRKPRTDLRVDMLASRLDSLGLEPTQATIDSLINPMSDMQVSTDLPPLEALSPLTLPPPAYTLPAHQAPPAPTKSRSSPSPPTSLLQITFPPHHPSTLIFTTLLPLTIPLSSLATRAPTLRAFHALLPTHITHTTRLRRRNPPTIARLVFRVKRDGLERVFILDGLDNGGGAARTGMGRDVWEDGEGVYRGFLEGCGLVSGRGNGGGGGMAREEGVRASRVFFGGREVGRKVGGAVDEVKGSRVEWATCEVEFGEGSALLEMELDDLPV